MERSIGRVRFGPGSVVYIVVSVLIAFAAFYTQANLLFWVLGLVVGAMIVSAGASVVLLRGIEIRRLTPSRGAASAPDVNTFTQIIPDLAESFMSIFWMNDGRLTFRAVPEGQSHEQIYVWDGKNLENLSQNSDYTHGSQTWSNDGWWAFQTLDLRRNLVYVKDEDNLTIFVEEGNRPIWSSGSVLAFCRGTDLLVWDGEETLTIVTGGAGARWLIGSSSTYRLGTRAICWVG